MPNPTQRHIQAWINQRQAQLDLRLSEVQKAARHKCFISFHQPDEDEVKQFIADFDSVFIPKVLGVSDEDDFIDSDDTDYVIDQIRERYLTDSTVTVVLVGRCTWARRYVDWEVYSTLRNDTLNRRSGLVAITLPSASDYSGKKLPPRVDDNVDGTDGGPQDDRDRAPGRPIASGARNRSASVLRESPAGWQARGAPVARGRVQ
jgi:hypothetical protein